MKLDEYVKQTLLDITSGVADAQKSAPLWIAPGMVEGEPRLTPQMVKFEVEVVVSKEGAGGIKVWSVGEANAQVSSQKSNRISFEVPVYFQSQTPSHPNFAENYPNLASNDEELSETKL